VGKSSSRVFRHNYPQHGDCKSPARVQGLKSRHSGRGFSPRPSPPAAEDREKNRIVSKCPTTDGPADAVNSLRQAVHCLPDGIDYVPEAINGL
jgi:hypothetical protein